MIEYLEKLVEEREHAEGLALAEQLMLNPDNTMCDMLRINHAMQICRLYLNELHGSLVSGQLAMKLAIDLEQWDYFGTACINLAVAHGTLGHHSDALELAYQYLSRIDRYSTSRAFEVRAWYNIGVAQGHLGNGNEAIKALNRAIELATDYEDLLYAHGVRHALIGAHLSLQDYETIPCLLARCIKFLRDHRGRESMDTSLLWHYILRARFAIATRRLERASRVALRGLHLAVGRPEYLFEFHLLLSRISIAREEWSHALTHALSARISAIRAHRYDSELAASELVYDITRHDPGVLLEVKPEHVLPVSELFFHGTATKH